MKFGELIDNMIRIYHIKFGVDMYFSFHSREILKYLVKAGTIVKRHYRKIPISRIVGIFFSRNTFQRLDHGLYNETRMSRLA